MKIALLWDWWQTPAVGPLSEQVRRELAQERGVGEPAAADLQMAVRRGIIASREVSSFRVFCPRAALAEGVTVKQFEDLDTHPRLRLYSGHIEGDGRIVLDPLHSVGSVIRRRGEQRPAGEK